MEATILLGNHNDCKIDTGRYVENKGYNVLYLTKFFLKDEMKKIILKAIENAKQNN